jgi:hypothetical protein
MADPVTFDQLIVRPPEKLRATRPEKAAWAIFDVMERDPPRTLSSGVRL